MESLSLVNDGAHDSLEKAYEDYEIFVPDFEFSEELNACSCLCEIGRAHV